MAGYDPLYRVFTGYRRRGNRWAGSSLPDVLAGTYRHGSYAPIETGHVAQENTGGPPANAEHQRVYGPVAPFYDGNPTEYETPEPRYDSAIGTTPPIRFSPPVVDEPRVPQYDDALMDDWLMARAMNEPAEPMGTLDERTDSTSGIPEAPDTASLDLLAARMDPLAPEAFRRLRDLPFEDLEEDKLFSAAALLQLFAPPGAFGPGPGPLF